jgi:hypothetical protein
MSARRCFCYNEARARLISNGVFGIQKQTARPRAVLIIEPSFVLLAAQNLMANRLINYLETRVGETERAHLTFQEEKGHCCFA